MDQQSNFPDPGMIQRLVEEAEAEAISENSAVRVVAGPGGQIKDIDLRMNAFQMSGVELGEMIVETIRAAHARLDGELAAAIGRATGFTVSSEDLGGNVFGSGVNEEDR